MSPTNSAQLMQENACSRPSRRVPRSYSYDQPPSNDHNVVSRRQGASSFPTHARFPSDTSHTSRLSDQPVSSTLTLSPASTSSALSWSESFNTQGQLSPVTPELSYSPATTIASPEVTPITAFLSEFYEPDSKSGSGAHTLVCLSRSSPQRLDLFGERDRMGMRNKKLPEIPASCVVGKTSPPLPDEIHLTESLPSMSSTRVSSEHGSEYTPLDVPKSRRFCRNFGEPFRPNDLIHDEFPTYLTKDLPVTHSSSLPPSPLDHDILPPRSRSEVCNLLSEDETTAVREFLRVWGSNNRVKVSRSKSQMGEDEALGAHSDDDYSWEAAEVEDGFADLTPSCSILLQEVSQMVLPLEKSTMEGFASIASTPPSLDTPDQLTQHSHEISQSLELPSSYQSAALVRSPSILLDIDGANVGDGTPSGVCQRVDEPLDVAPQPSVTSGSVSGSNASIREDQVEVVAAKSMDVPVVPVVLVTPPDCDAVPHRQLSLRKARSADGNLRRRGQIFNVEKPLIHDASSVVVDLYRDMSYVPTRNPPPLPSLPAPSVRRVSALDRLESSLSRLKAHGSHQRKSSRVEKVSGALEDRKPPPSAFLRERKHQSSVAIRIPDCPSGHGRHFSSPMPDVASDKNRSRAPRAETALNNARLQERAAKLFPYPENKELSMRSFMEMDVAPPKAPPPRRTSRLGRVAARLSQGVTNWGKNFAGSRGVKESALGSV
ncbi:uncharacterized protein EDB91DRAFT_1078348 [Suillus paluster]|uniref:uncharacterized protein n=1 Tax=Suillus paluster TaxID=48578 RepID=UPI001B883C35|nr:uncharacterized protein EDB91DRAFT_1078348 [Suillus paluster]KAG1751605.1 hypothetical protein EDB91DRAFT_1078348 [Suillus paluster]